MASEKNNGTPIKLMYLLKMSIQIDFQSLITNLTLSTSTIAYSAVKVTEIMDMTEDMTGYIINNLVFLFTLYVSPMHNI